MSRQEVPEPWAGAMRRRGFTDPRTGAASMSALSRAGGPSVETIRRLVHKVGEPSDSTVTAVADLLDIPHTKARKWAALNRGEEEPFVLPARANQLTRKQRDVVISVIAALLES